MRALSSFLTTLAATAIGTSALEASIYTFGPIIDRQDLKPTLISSATLQQLLDLRSGSSTPSIIGRADEGSIELLSNLAGFPSPLFNSPTDNGYENTLLVLLEGLTDSIDTSLRTKYQSELVASAFPTESSMNAFFDSFLEARREDLLDSGGKSCLIYGSGSPNPDQKDGLSCLPDILGTHRSALLNLISTGESFINEHMGTIVLRVVLKPLTNLEALPTSISNLDSVFSDLRSFGLAGNRATAVVLPGSNTTHKSYSRRSLEMTKIDSEINFHRNAQPVLSEQETKVPLTLAPVCYGSNSSCTESTNSCSGHGVCYKKSGTEGDCYACRCHDTLVKNEDGTERLVRWGGAACQKKDISSPFFLISGVTIAIIVVIGTAIGMIYSVGTAELPGVISAGVGAPRTQK
ncbi:hypothetical protein BJX68DRAFT_224154 [Aspergillus pseudodeflectus]|uniref:Vacuolar sorting protein Vps3844 C-terminal domain-containing protein n=1 Tax=Aspergillus pseudodeflectus TaxID=176178 RepID=A0ABR4LCB1_9EURO